MPYGTLTTLDTLASTFQSVADFGEDRLWEESIQPLLDAHNRIMMDMFGDLAERTTDRQRRYGTTDTLKSTKIDEHGRDDSQKAAPGAVAGFPLDAYGSTLGWTRKYLQNISVSEFAGQILAIRDADVQRVINEVKRAIFTPTNYNFDDYLVDHLNQIQLAVKALLNADGLGIPAGPNGEVFDGTTHTHYLATASYVVANLTAALETVLEHYNEGEAVIAINRAQETATAAFAGFTYLQPVNIIGPTTAAQVMGAERLNRVRLYNRHIGYFGGAEVWVKPWVPANYIFVYMRNQPKPLAIRSRTPVSYQLELVADDEKYPLRARSWEREFGAGVWNRTNGAVLQTNSGTYTAPTIAA